MTHSGNTPANQGDLPPRTDVIRLPAMIYDGYEQARMEVLRTFAEQYLAEMDIAFEEEITTRDQQPLVSDFSDVEEYLAWRGDNPEPRQRVEEEWSQRLGLCFTNNLYILFITPFEGQLMINSETIRKYMGLLETQDPQFVASHRIASDSYAASTKNELDLARKSLDLSREERIDQQLLRWNCEFYATEARNRFEVLGATSDEIGRLQN